ncbi:site-specific integrase [Nitrospinae bacterium AH_259_B05_G02_I21]|nr:site-specific integrase [Nitrospinae bacterium AH_259_B05_G02_I21]
MAQHTIGKSNMGITAREKPANSGRWRLFYNRGGKSREIPGLTFKTKQAAEEVAEKLRSRLALGLPLHEYSQDHPPIDQYALGWLERMKRQVKANSLKAYGIEVRRHILSYFGSKPINEIRPADVRAFLDHLAEGGLAEKTIQNIRTTLSSIFRSAVEEERVERNPVSLVRLRYSRRRRKKQYNTLTLEELHRLLDTIQSHYLEWHPFFTVLAYTGLRVSEIRGLRWASVNLGDSAKDPRRFLLIRETVTGTNLVDDVTKTGAERRTDLNMEARQALLDHHISELSAGRGRPTDFVFCRPGGSHIAMDRPSEILTKACALAGLNRITPVDLRHTLITIMLYELEEDLLYVIEQVGHSSVQMILDHYGHPERYHRPEKMDRMAPKSAIHRPSLPTVPVSPWKTDTSIPPPTGVPPPRGSVLQAGEPHQPGALRNGGRSSGGGLQALDTLRNREGR